ncbi:MAG: hypothetical protein ACOCVF_02145 [bacterium]
MNVEEYLNKLKAIKLDKSDNQVDKILQMLEENVNFAFARFNDGEMMGIDKIGAKVARGDQIVNESLHKALKESIQYKQENYYVGIPCSICFPRYYQLAKSLVKQPEKFQLNAVALTNRNWKKFILKFPETIKGKKVLWISGKDQNIEPLRKMGIDVSYQLTFNSKNSWGQYNKLRFDFENLLGIEYDIVIISLGPAARVFVREYFEKIPNKTFIDIGSTFDPFTRNVWHNCHKGWIETGFNLTKSCKVCN